MIVRLPAALGQSGKSGMLDVRIGRAATLRDVLQEVDRQVPGTVARLLDGNGDLHRFVNLYVNGDDVRQGAGIDTGVSEDDEVLILPAISGG